MSAVIKKYNPGFLSDDEIVASFCVRDAEFETLLESLHASNASSNVHSLVIGPRGSGEDASVAAGGRGDPPRTIAVGFLSHRVR